jgi:Undecaprenyl-phosphate galactose phosphotransferase WbaP
MTLSEFDLIYKKNRLRTTSLWILFAMIITDLIGAMLSIGTGFFLVNLYNQSAINFRSFVTYWPYLPIFILLFQMQGLYPGISLAPAEELRRITIGSLIAHGGIVISRYIEDQDFGAVSVAIIISFCFSILIMLICRSSARFLICKTSFGRIPVVIFGAGDKAKLICDKLLKNRELFYWPVLFLDNNNDNKKTEYRGVPIIRDVLIGRSLVTRYNFKTAIVALPPMDFSELSKIFNISVSAFRYNVLIEDHRIWTNIWMSVRDFSGILGFATTHKLKIGINRAVKRFMDLLIVTLGGLCILPLLLLISLIVKLTSKGPVLYAHKRIGQNGKILYTYKFRSMVADADKRLHELLARDQSAKQEWEADHKLKNDPRITTFGKILRRISFDEFPQLINVLKGEMSLVGPRPVTDDERVKYGENFDRIFSAKPGLTGLWQVSGRSDADYVDRVAFDTYYLESWSIWLDLWILYKTLGAVLGKRGAY